LDNIIFNFFVAYKSTTKNSLALGQEHALLQKPTDSHFRSGSDPYFDYAMFPYRRELRAMEAIAMTTAVALSLQVNCLFMLSAVERCSQ